VATVSASDPRPLAGAGIIVTRPARQAGGFVQQLAVLGASTIVYPAIVILPPPDRAPLDRVHASLAAFDAAVFVSANAAEYGAPSPHDWPPSLPIYAPGPGTAAALAAVGLPQAIIPTTTFDTEGLLRLPGLAHVAGKRIVVFRGEGGREALGHALANRGATVEYVACYRRAAPQTSPQGLIEAMRTGRANALTLTSAEGLDNLWHLLAGDGRVLAKRLPTFAPHPRIAERARELGLNTVETPGSDAGLIAGLIEWFAANPPPPKHDHAPG
jgi:uroporphyrinogen-III synthase